MTVRGIARTTLGEDARHEGFLRHKGFRWLKASLVLCLACLLAYALIDQQPRPSGGTAYGYTLGTIATLLILWLTMLGVRKRAMTRGRWSLKGWTSAHVYLGLSLVVIATLHTGFDFGWNVHTLAYALMMLVILSGIWGVTAYATLPEALSNSRSEMTRPQMIDAIVKLDRQLQSAAQPLADSDTAIVRRALADDPFRAGVFRRLSASPRGCRTDAALAGLRKRLALATGDEAEAIEGVVALLERKAAALARIRQYLRLRALLEIWLYVHVPLTFALIAALAAHILSVFFYW
ncbi:MAG: hypothetical protein QOJ94_17 [Sphingomonadales bacterium]|jgi:hypothetical protein|nr:hypothetical protein [Sphingomonadales bacterium]